jgi:hypothetical protein
MMELATLHGVDAGTALRLRAFTGLSVLDCCKALRACEGDYDMAVRWIADGHWANGSLISWNHEVLKLHAHTLQVEFGGDTQAHYALLKKTGGKLEFAQYVLRQRH